jgi:hypothetical protein
MLYDAWNNAMRMIEKAIQARTSAMKLRKRRHSAGIARAEKRREGTVAV